MVTRTRTCTACGEDLPLTAQFFYASNTSKSGFQSRCKLCQGATGVRVPVKQRRAEPRLFTEPKPRRHRKGRGCRLCEGLPHRRPENGRACACGGFYTAEPPMTVTDALAAPRNYSREVAV